MILGVRIKHEEEPDLRTNRESCLEVKGKANTYLRSRIAIFFFFFYLIFEQFWEMGTLWMCLPTVVLVGC